MERCNKQHQLQNHREKSSHGTGTDTMDKHHAEKRKEETRPDLICKLIPHNSRSGELLPRSLDRLRSLGHPQ